MKRMALALSLSFKNFMGGRRREGGEMEGKQACLCSQRKDMLLHANTCQHPFPTYHTWGSAKSLHTTFSTHFMECFLQEERRLLFLSLPPPHHVKQKFGKASICLLTMTAGRQAPTESRRQGMLGTTKLGSPPL